jgi:formylglycine-generating enzyme required for sulfatase activity
MGRGLLERQLPERAQGCRRWTGGDCHLRVLRGGSFASKPGDVRSAARFRYDSDVRYYANGFRIVRDLQ